MPAGRFEPGRPHADRFDAHRLPQEARVDTIQKMIESELCVSTARTSSMSELNVLCVTQARFDLRASYDWRNGRAQC